LRLAEFGLAGSAPRCNRRMSSTASQRSNMLQTILRLPSVKAATGYSRSTLYLRISQGLWPKQVSLGARAVGWPADEVDAMNAARISGKNDNEIRALVLRLEAARALAEPTATLDAV
jgi:prophage regulatory protein